MTGPGASGSGGGAGGDPPGPSSAGLLAGTPLARLPRHENLYDLGLFGATVAVASWQEWSARDLLWSLWISSLLVGYAFILVTLFVGNDGESDGSGGGEGGGADSRAWSAVALALVLFTFSFFTFHFVGFHWGHAFFLNQFFPLVEPSAGLFGEGGPVWFAALIGTAVERYWPFVAATALSRRDVFRRSVAASPDRDETMMQPYRNVVRMHLLIFVYGGLQAAGMSNWFLYAVLVFYFFPLESAKELVGLGGGDDGT